MSDLCSDCPPVGYPTDITRCTPCPRRAEKAEAAITAEPSRVEDSEVESLRKRLTAELIVGWGGSAEAVTEIAREAVDLLSRIAAAKASAEKNAEAATDTATAAVADASMAQAKLREARGLALEEAAKACEREATNRERAKPAKGIGRLPNDVSALHLLRAAEAIRALSNPE